MLPIDRLVKAVPAVNSDATSISPKVTGSAIAVGLSTPLSILLDWVAKMFGLDLPLEVTLAFAGIIATAASAVSGYFIRDPQRTGP